MFIHKPTGHSVRVITGGAQDPSGIRSVQVSVIYLGKGGSCRYLATPKTFKTIACYLFGSTPFLQAAGRKHWALRLPRSIKGPIVLRARAIDNVGNVGQTQQLSVTLR